MSQNKSSYNVDFQLNKNFLIGGWLFINNIFFYKTNYRFDYFREIFYKSLIKIIKVDKDLYLL